MTGVYEHQGLRFLYPENWRLSDENPDSSPHVVSVQSPNGGFWSAHFYPTPQDSGELVSEALRAMRQEYESLEFEPKTEQIGEIEAVGFDLEFYCLDLLVTARLRGFDHDGQTVLLLNQAENRDYEKLAPVFLAVTLSLLQQSPAQD